MLDYLPSTNQVALLNDAGVSWLTAIPGAAGTLQNSQCSVNMAATSVTMNGNTLTLNLAMTFQAGFAGSKTVYMYAADASASISGWQQPGTWTVAGTARTPAVVSVSPNSGSGLTQSFALAYSDTAGGSNLQSVWVWFSATFGSAANSCMLDYLPSTNQVALLNDAGVSWLTATPGAASTIENSQCSVNMAATSVTVNGNNLTLNLAMTFQAGFAGSKTVYMYAADTSGSNSGWQQPGAWTVQ
jgi:hypothetical protein